MPPSQSPALLKQIALANSFCNFAANGNLQEDSMSARTSKPRAAQESDKAARSLDKK
jgi:hypothetical protein